jgi:hypothetical protein
VKELAAAYWQFAESFYMKDGEPTGELPGVKAVLRILEELYGEARLDQFGSLSLKAVRERMVARGNSRRYVNKYVGRIKSTFKWGVENELVPVAVYQSHATVAGLKRGKTLAKDYAPVEPVSDEVIERTLTHRKPKIVAMVQLQRLLGCRCGELCNRNPGPATGQLPDQLATLMTVRGAGMRLGNTARTRHRQRAMNGGPAWPKEASPNCSPDQSPR